jgi:hypothetical protein
MFINIRILSIISFLGLILLSFPFSSIGGEFSYSFIIRIYGKKVRVISPKKYSAEISLIVENKSLQKQIGKIMTTKGELISFIAVDSNKTVSKKISIKKGVRLIFIPLSPAFQEIELIEGKESYEIPPRQKY